jgi:hypothetical protein
MIQNALTYTKDSFNQFLRSFFHLDEEVVAINRVVDANGNLPMENTNKVILSLIHIEEETNQQFYGKTRRTNGGDYTKETPSQRFNLFVLLVPNFENYLEGLNYLNASIQFFQVNAVLNADKNSNIPEGIHRLEFELEKGEGYMQMQNLWTALGAKYQPSLIYKMRLVSVNARQLIGFDTQIHQASNTGSLK